LASIVWALAGCSLAPDPVVPATVAALPADFEQADVPAAYRPLGWWKSFDDPVLRAVDRNLDFVQAVARVEQARAQASIAGAPLLPEISARVGANRQDQPESGFSPDGLDSGGLWPFCKPQSHRKMAVMVIMAR
jgi:outer membrane protein TolC